MTQDAIYQKIIKIIEQNNPAVRTSLPVEKAKQLAGANIELLVTSLEVSSMCGSLIRLFFDKEFNKKYPTSVYKKLALQKLVKIKNFCHNSVEIANFQNNLILRKKDENEFIQFAKENKSLESMISDIGGNQNELIEKLDIYENSVEFLADFMIEYCNVFRAKDVQEHEKQFLAKIQSAVQEYFDNYSNFKQKSSMVKYYNKINKALKIEK